MADQTFSATTICAGCGWTNVVGVPCVCGYGTDGPTGLPAAQELLPCPFCDGPGEVVKSEHAYGFYGACDACGVCLCVRRTYRSAAKHWNRRAPQVAAPGGVAPTPSPDLAEENKRLKSLLRELYATVNGESPALLDEDSGGNSVLALDIEDALRNGEPG